MSRPWRFAAWMMVSPACAEMVSPFSLNSMPSALPTGSFIFMSDLAGEMLRDAADRVRRRLAEAADGGIRHRGRQLPPQTLGPLLRFHPVRGFRRADTARRAEPAPPLRDEAHE